MHTENRSKGALVIHSPTVANIRLGDNDEDDWGDDIINEVLSESDIVLGREEYVSRRSTISFDCADLCTTIRNNGVTSIILIGFLSGKDIVGAAISISDHFPDLLIMVCSDVCADERKMHEGAMEKALPVIGMHVITCTEAIETFKIESHDQVRESLEKKSSAISYMEEYRSRLVRE